MRRGLGVALALVVGLTAGPAVAAPELMLSAAISLKDALAELTRTFAAAHPGVAVRANLGPSGELQKQIEAGAPVDVFLSAAARQMDELELQGRIQPATRVVFATNTLVVVTPADGRPPPAGPAELGPPTVRRLAVGNPRTVPAGYYAAESLRALGLWARLQPVLIYGENVRQVLEYVARGEVDAGVVYETDARIRAGRVRTAFTLPAASHAPIVYPAAVLRDARQPGLGRAFLALLVSPEGRTVLARYGFQPPAGTR